MGFLTSVASRIEGFFGAGDPNRVITKLSVGGNAERPGPQPFNLLTTYGEDALAQYLRLDTGLLQRYADYEDMDDYPETSSALDIFADDATQPDITLNRTMWFTSPNARVQKRLEQMAKRIELDEEAWEMCRSLVKYGNDFEELLVTDEGVIGQNYLPAPTMRRVEGRYGELYGFVQDPRGKLQYTLEEWQALWKRRMESARTGSSPEDLTLAFEDWEVVHGRLRGKQRRSVYGHSVLESGRWIWRRLMLLEDAAMIYRLHRAPERFAFYINVGDRTGQEAFAYLNQYRQMFRRKKFVNPTTGKIDSRNDPMNSDDDFYIAFRPNEEGNRVEILQAPAWQSMDDIDYFRTKLFAALKIPKAYLGDQEGVVRAVLSSQDIRFARTILRVQRELKAMFRHTGEVHLAATNIDPFSVPFDVNMTVPSSLLELAQVEAKAARSDLAARMQAQVSLYWVLSHIYNMGDEEIEAIFQQRYDDTMRDAQAQADAQKLMMQGMPQEGAPEGEMPPGEEAPAEEPYPPEEGPEEAYPPEGEARETRAVLSERRKAAHERARRVGVMLPSGRRFARHGLTEAELFRGANREMEKRLDGKLETILKQDRLLAGRLLQLGGLLNDLKGSTRKPR